MKLIIRTNIHALPTVRGEKGALILVKPHIALRLRAGLVPPSNKNHKHFCSLGRAARLAVVGMARDTRNFETSPRVVNEVIAKRHDTLPMTRYQKSRGASFRELHSSLTGRRAA